MSYPCVICDELITDDIVKCPGCDSENRQRPDYDPTPWCSYGHRSKADCDCGPIADND
jgi:hypothetical protein